MGSGTPKPGVFGRLMVVVMVFSMASRAQSEEKREKSAALEAFQKGVVAFRAHQDDEARTHLTRSLELKTLHAARAHDFLARLEIEKGETEGARRHWNSALAALPAPSLEREIQFALAKVDLQKGQLRAAQKRLQRLAKVWRSHERYPEVMYGQLEIAVRLKSRRAACIGARRLYSRYPAHPVVAEWSVDLARAQVGGVRLGCLARPVDIRERLNRLELAGQGDRVVREIGELEKQVGRKGTFEIDRLWVNHMMAQGDVDGALQRLLVHQEKRRNQYDYLMLLGKTAARAGEFPTAVGAYHRAHELQPRSRGGKKALYAAAFLSYQFEDYDGASRKFDRFVKLYQKSGLSRDAQWHLAWLRYLKNDYTGAIAGFNEIYKERRRRPRLWRHHTDEKISYWLAMSHLRLNQPSEARPLFERVAQTSQTGYYGLAARQRLIRFDGDNSSVRQVASLFRSPAQDVDPELVSDAETETETGAETEAGVDEAKESEENLDITAEDEDSTSNPGESEEEELSTAATSEAGEDVFDLPVQDQKLILSLSRARELLQIGFHDWAGLELAQLERRIRRPAELRQLLQVYQELSAYHRLAQLSELNFSRLRSEFSDETQRSLWQLLYPKAYESEVRGAQAQFQVPSELVWSIMRAESLFRQDAVSPVGARGLMQIMPFTAQQVVRLLGDNDEVVASLLRPEVNIRIGVRYLGRLLQKFNQQVPLVAAAYNAGPHRVDAWMRAFGHLDSDEFIEHIPFAETRNYVKKVIRNWVVYNELYLAKPPTLSWLASSLQYAPLARNEKLEVW